MTGDEIKEMINFYLGKDIMIHINLSTGKFYNGLIINWEDDSVIVFNDRVLGSIRIFISQIVELEEFREVGE